MENKCSITNSNCNRCNCTRRPVINPVTSEDTTITGKAEPNSTVTLTFPDGTTQVTTADASGNYTVNIPSNEDFTGGETIKASAKRCSR